MSADPITLPGSIPGLLRRGSPARWRDEDTPYVVLWYGPWPDDDDVGNGAIVLAGPCSSPCLGVEDCASNFALDLTDPTGQVHAAWWALDHHSDLWRAGDYDVTDSALYGRADPATLRSLCLRLAGLETP